MIIKRKYEIIGELVRRDPDARKILMDALLMKNDKNNAEKILEADAEAFLYLRDMNLCIPDFENVMHFIDELDEKKPYDNGLTYRDVTRAMPFSSREGNALEVWLINSPIEKPSRIVQIIAFDNKDGKTSFIRPWDVPFIVS